MPDQQTAHSRAALEFSYGGRKYRLDGKFANYVAIEKATGQTIMELAAAIPVRGLTIEQIQKVLAVTARPKLPPKKALQVVEKLGIVPLADLLGRLFLAALVTSQKT